MPPRRPVFLPPDGPDGVTLFCPSGMSPAVYKAALVKLSDYTSSRGMNMNQVLMSGVKIGQQGEIHVCVGKEELVVYPGCGPLDLYKEYSTLNQGQKDAVKKVLCAQDYTLLLGLPGTGKTSTLSLIVRALIARGQRVMICSYTHSAVDNLLAKMSESGLTSSVAVRIGYEASVSSALRGYVLLLYVQPLYCHCYCYCVFYSAYAIAVTRNITSFLPSFLPSDVVSILLSIQHNTTQ